ncbi:monoacylglycerol lipase ABHD6 [Suncus etruscus]|uniref:monoacylglycerol lipase ABHD6 n=1 Tax=Suncus etruscus TaxID=109475 RepID=UPI0021103D86|nr:monoacylglycerol lipase ABHD6 [Suncus etruscus]
MAAVVELRCTPQTFVPMLGSGVEGRDHTIEIKQSKALFCPPISYKPASQGDLLQEGLEVCVILVGLETEPSNGSLALVQQNGVPSALGFTPRVSVPNCGAARYWRRTLGMQVRYVQHEDYQFCYSFRGRPGPKPSILMLHGFSAHKDMWLSVVKFLPKNLHLVCVDMPGHEGTTRSSLDDLSIDGQVKRIHQFVECLKLNKKPFHLIGTSMGGHVAGVYAAYYPSDLCSLSLVCPAGLEYPIDNKFIQRLKELQATASIEKIPLIPSTPEEMSEMLQLCSYVRFKVPQQILQGLVDVRIPHNGFYRKLFLEIVSEKSRYSLQENMNKINVPTQIIWGKQDQVLDVSGADMLAKSIANCQVELLENCGHSVVMERPRKTAKLIVDFLASLHDSDNNKKLN